MSTLPTDPTRHEHRELGPHLQELERVVATLGNAAGPAFEIRPRSGHHHA